MSIKVCKLTEWGPLFAQKYSSCMGSEVMVASCIRDSANAGTRPAGNPSGNVILLQWTWFCEGREALLPPNAEALLRKE